MGGQPWGRTGGNGKGQRKPAFYTCSLRAHPQCGFFSLTELGWGKSHSSLLGELLVHRASVCKLENECPFLLADTALCRVHGAGLVDSLTPGRHGRGPPQDNKASPSCSV